MSRGSLVGVAASCLFLGASAQADPPSRAIDPPPGALDYVEKLAPKQWMFGRLLWQGLEPSTRDRCEAAYNAAPLSILVAKEKVCCGGPGYSIKVTGSVSGCPA